MFDKPETQHQWLKRLVGDWTFEAECGNEGGESVAKFSGTESVRMIGDLWSVAEGKGEMPGGGVGQTVMSLGYDPKKGRFVGTWLGSMLTYLWVYEGSLNSEGTKLTLDTVGPNCMGGGEMATFQEAIEFKSDDHRVFTSAMKGPNGEWTTMMTANYRRTK